MTELADHATDYSVVEREPPEVMARNLRIASHLWSSATAFFFAAFLFAYFYLRSLDSSAVWRPKHVDPSFTLGTLATRRARCRRGAPAARPCATTAPDARPAWRLKGAIAARLAAGRRRPADRRVVDAGLRADGRPVRERLPRLDGPAGALRGRPRLLGRDDARHLDSLPALGSRVDCPRGTAQATRTGPRRTSRTRCRSSARSSRRCRSTRSSWRGSASSPGSSSTCSEPWASCFARRTGRSSGRSPRSRSPRCSTSLGGRMSATASDAGKRWRGAAFYGGLATLALAVDSPIDAYAGRLFWVHMVQHVLLMMVAPPLLLLGRPWPRVVAAAAARPSPAARARACSRGRRSHRFDARSAGSPRRCRRSRCSTARCSLWHLPALYDLTLRDGPVHDLEHALFFGTALLFWVHLVPGAVRTSAARRRRAARSTATAALLVSWLLAVVLGLAPEPALRRLRVARAPAGRPVGARRPAARGRGDVGAGLGAVLHRPRGRRRCAGSIRRRVPADAGGSPVSTDNRRLREMPWSPRS